ncbi:hypothetical protein EVAR_80909_1 [Eumeta japonica]|uniref:Uncharacterized protein n=1 Tax=Eumeta variegata TaxID=151549 RepID=A0A4C1V1I8_EUMVA|nr:hypothetical protein EVAR_80909_1 [Eumeta japonica]
MFLFRDSEVVAGLDTQPRVAAARPGRLLAAPPLDISIRSPSFIVRVTLVRARPDDHLTPSQTRPVHFSADKHCYLTALKFIEPAISRRFSSVQARALPRHAIALNPVADFHSPPHPPPLPSHSVSPHHRSFSFNISPLHPSPNKASI